MWRVLDHDPQSGTTEYVCFHNDGPGWNFTIKASADVERIVERNKERQKEKNWNKDLSLHWVGSVDMVTAWRWIIEDGVNWLALPKEEQSKYIKRKLNDPDWRMFKTTEARL